MEEGKASGGSFVRATGNGRERGPTIRTIGEAGRSHRQESSIGKHFRNLFYSLMDPLFDHEKLDVYCVELGFVAWLAAFLDDASQWSALSIDGS
jgi:hypothetical protein